MAATLQEAVTALSQDGPAGAEQIGGLTRETQQLQMAVDEFEASLLQLKDGFSEEEVQLLAGVRTLVDQFVSNQAQLSHGMQEVDGIIRNMQAYLSSTQDQLKTQLGVASARMNALQDQWAKFPPLLQQAVDNQDKALQQSRTKVQQSMDDLSRRVNVAAEQFGNLKQHTQNHQKTVGSHVQSLVHQVKASQTHAQVQAQTLHTNSTTVTQSFETNMKATLSTVVDQPGQRMQQGLEALKRNTAAQIEGQIDHLLDKGLGEMLRTLQNIGRRNDNIVAELQRLVPERLSQGARSLGYVISRLDIILKKLANKAISGAQNMLNGAIDWLSDKLNINLDILKKAVDTVANVARFTVELGMGPMTLARTILTDPGRLGAEIQSMQQSAWNAASSVGRLVGI